jgi:hypothetical protein
MRRLSTILALTALLLTGCVINIGSSAPECAPATGEVSRAVIVIAQSVPSASWVPCVVSIPVGWNYQSLDAHDGSARFWFDSERDGAKALGIELTPSCRVAGATEVPSERLGVRRYELVTQVSPGYFGKRYYTFPGGCITFHFELKGTTRGEPLAVVSQAIGFVSRQSVRDFVRKNTHGRLSLDPSESEPS